MIIIDLLPSFNKVNDDVKKSETPKFLLDTLLDLFIIANNIMKERIMYASNQRYSQAVCDG